MVVCEDVVKQVAAQRYGHDVLLISFLCR